MNDYVLNTAFNFRTSCNGKVVHSILPMSSQHGFFYIGVQMGTSGADCIESEKTGE